jgi:hypothetical protein
MKASPAKKPGTDTTFFDVLNQSVSFSADKEQQKRLQKSGRRGRVVSKSEFSEIVAGLLRLENKAVEKENEIAEGKADNKAKRAASLGFLKGATLRRGNSKSLGESHV